MIAAEEYGMLGSVNYAETHAANLTANGVVYIVRCCSRDRCDAELATAQNVDISVTGSQLGADGSPAMEPWFRSITRRINDPVSHRPLANVSSYTFVRRCAGLICILNLLVRSMTERAGLWIGLCWLRSSPRRARCQLRLQWCAC